MNAFSTQFRVKHEDLRLKHIHELSAKSNNGLRYQSKDILARKRSKMFHETLNFHSVVKHSKLSPPDSFKMLNLENPYQNHTKSAY